MHLYNVTTYNFIKLLKYSAQKMQNKILIKEMFFNRISNWTGYSKIHFFRQSIILLINCVPIRLERRKRVTHTIIKYLYQC